MAPTLQTLTFRHGETVQISISAKERDGTTALASAGSATLYLTIAAAEDADPLYQFSSSPQVVLGDGPTARWDVTLAPADVPLLTEARTYFLNVWTVRTGTVIFQARATLTLAASILYS